MADPAEELPVDPIPDPSLVCGLGSPPCEYVGKGKLPKLDLGRHRLNHHGIRTKSATPKAERSRRASSPKKDSTPREPSVSRRARTAATSVTKSARRIGTIITPRLPIAGTYAMHNAEELGDLLAEIASDNAKLLEWLEKGEGVAAWIGLAWWTAGFAYSVGVDLERLPEDGTVADELGVSEIVAKVDRALDERERKLRASGAITVEPVENGDHRPASVLDGGTGPRSQDVETG